jgi:hypothetical protein
MGENPRGPRREINSAQNLVFPRDSAAKSDHRRLAHFITEREEIPPCPPLKKGGSAQRGGISVGDCANVMGFDLDFLNDGSHVPLAFHLQIVILLSPHLRRCRYLAFFLQIAASSPFARACVCDALSSG